MPTTGLTNPSSILAESLAALSKSAYQAFAEVENQARQDVTKANSDAREARLERDKTLEALHVAQLDSQALQKEVAGMKAALKQTDLTMSHHKETIAQLRREATQWKDQSRNWQEHFLRVEQERCSLTTRVEELVAERLQWIQPLPSFPPNEPDNEHESISSNSKRPSISPHKRPPSSPDVDSPSTSISGHKSQRSAPRPIKLKPKDSTTPSLLRDPSTSGQHSKALKLSPHSPPRPPSRVTVLRRVHAVIDVKQEESDEESEKSFVEEALAPHITKRSSLKKRKASNVDDDYVSGEESDSVPSGSRQYDEDNEDDEDDELMLGADDNNTIYNTRGKPSQIASSQSLLASPSKKRRVVAGRNKPPARRKI